MCDHILSAAELGRACLAFSLPHSVLAPSAARFNAETAGDILELSVSVVLRYLKGKKAS